MVGAMEEVVIEVEEEEYDIVWDEIDEPSEERGHFQVRWRFHDG